MSKTIDSRVYTAFSVLLQASLWKTDVVLRGAFPLSEKEWQSLFDFAKYQAVTPILYDAVSRLPIELSPGHILVAKWLVAANQTAILNEDTARVTEEVREIWKKRGINAVVLKGLEAAKLYPVPEHRTCGDVDWFFNTGEEWEKARLWAEELGVNPTADSDGCIHYKYKDVMMDHHHLHINPEDKAEVLAMNILHILKHAMVMGIGVRQFCDLALAYKAFRGQYSTEHLRETLARNKALKWAALLNAFLVYELGLDEGNLPEIEGSDWIFVPRRDVDRLRDLVIGDGNFGLGKSNRFSGFCSRSRLFLKYSGSRYTMRWLGLFWGHLFNKNRKTNFDKVL